VKVSFQEKKIRIIDLLENECELASSFNLEYFGVESALILIAECGTIISFRYYYFINIYKFIIFLNMHSWLKHST